MGLEDDSILVCTSDAIWKAKDMRRDPRVARSVTDTADPYRMAAIQGRVVDVRPDEDCRCMDPISVRRHGPLLRSEYREQRPFEAHGGVVIPVRRGRSSPRPASPR